MLKRNLYISLYECWRTAA